MPTSRRIALRATLPFVVAFCVMASSCSDPGGTPREYGLSNGTQSTITIVHQGSDGHEIVLVENMPPGIGFPIHVNPIGPPDEICDRGIDIARDSEGRELARHEHDGCRAWFISDGSPTPFSIANKTAIPLTIVYLGPPAIIVANTIVPGASLTSTVQTFGDPSLICFGVLVARNSVGHEFARRQLGGCNDWTWKIQP
jgi:hypothetical protein